jgi:predicted permease
MGVPQLHSSISDWLFVPVILVAVFVAFFGLQHIDRREKKKRDLKTASNLFK